MKLESNNNNIDIEVILREKFSISILNAKYTMYTTNSVRVLNVFIHLPDSIICEI